MEKTKVLILMSQSGDNADLSSETYSDSSSYAPSDSEISCDDDDDDDNNLIDTWNPTMATTRSFSFTGNEHLAVEPIPSEADGTVSPFDVYKLFVTEDVLSHIVDETNRYARKSLPSEWSPTNKDEMSKLFGIIISMGIVNMPSIECYWSKKKIYAYDFVRKNISRNRFFLLLRMLHFNDNETFEQHRRLHKIEPILEMLRNNFKSVYSPGEKLVVDESNRQYIPGKSYKYDIKLYKLCAVNGYTWDLLSNKPEHNHSESIVLKLAKPLLKNGAIIYADNFYTSIPLAEKLLQEKTYYCGIVRKNGKLLPRDVMTAKLKKGDVIGKMNSKGVKVCHWKDKRDVFTLSTCPEHDAQLAPTGKKNRKGEEVMKPPSIIDYNAAKIGVDTSDQMTRYNSVLRKSTKWYRKLAIELLLGTSIVNAWVIYNQFCLRGRIKMSILEFKESVAMSLVSGISKEKLNPGPDRSLISGKRIGHELIEADGPKSKTRKRCRSCYDQIANAEGTKIARSKTRRVNTYCNTCEDKPHLCVSCFNLKHSSY